MLDHFMRKEGVKRYYTYKLTNQIARKCLMFREKKILIKERQTYVWKLVIEKLEIEKSLHVFVIG